MAKKNLWQRFKMLTFWNKSGFISAAITIIGSVISVLFYWLSIEAQTPVAMETTIINGHTNNAHNIINNGIIVLPEVAKPAEAEQEAEKKSYSHIDIIKSVYQDSVDYKRSSNNRVMARSLHGFYYSDTVENGVMFSGITPFKLDKVGAVFRSNYQLFGVASDLNTFDKTARIDIRTISMTDDYGNVFEITSKTNNYIGYVESQDKISQQVVNMEQTEYGFLFDYARDVQIILVYNEDDINLVGKIALN